MIRPIGIHGFVHNLRQSGRPAWLQGARSGAVTNYIGDPNNTSIWTHYWPHGAVYYYVRGNSVWHAASFNRRLQQTENYEATNNSTSSMLQSAPRAI